MSLHDRDWYKDDFKRRQNIDRISSAGSDEPSTVSLAFIIIFFLLAGYGLAHLFPFSDLVDFLTPYEVLRPSR